jgi:hypothetical protein
MILADNRQNELANNAKKWTTNKGSPEGPHPSWCPLVLPCGEPPLSYALEGEIFHIKNDLWWPSTEIDCQCDVVTTVHCLGSVG